MTVDPDIEAIARLGGVPTVLQVITETTGLRLALVARVTDDDWKALAVHDALGFGMKVGDHLAVATTLCSEARDARAPIVIEHASEDAVYSGHPTPKMYGFESYIATPIFLQDGSYFGNVCALDSRPLSLRDKKAVEMMTLFAKLISLQLDAEARAEHTRAALLDERQTAELREQFIAVLGHDLRNPLGSILVAAELLLARTLEDADRRIVERMRTSGRRMSRLVDDVLDFARGRLGGGIETDHALIDEAEAAFRQVIDEAASAKTRELRVCMTDVGTLRGDRVRLGQLLSNLVANAIEHGPADEPIDVVITGTPVELELTVRNGGAAIPDDVHPHLYQPFFRGGENKRSRTGLGLGLYIASEIVRSHHGTIAVTSTAEHGTEFRVRIPRNL